MKRGGKIKTQELNLIQLVLKIGLTRLGENYPKMILNELGSVASELEPIVIILTSSG